MKEDVKTSPKKKADKLDGIKVYARIRKFLAWETKEFAVNYTKWSISSQGYNGRKKNRSNQRKIYDFKRVFSPEEDNDIVFRELVTPLLDNVMDGYNSLLLAYGQTGAGKTYSLFGKPYLSVPVEGVISKAIRKFLSDPRVTSVIVRGFEAFGMKTTKIQIYDLLSPNQTVFDFKKTKYRTITSPEEGYAAVFEAQQNSHYAATGKNPESSRGHVVFVVEVTMLDDSNPETMGSSKRKASMVFADLAGSEGESALGDDFKKSVQPNEYKARRMEAGVINTGLSDLQMIFQELKRNGKLREFEGTGLRRILKQFINSGNTYISVLFCVSPSPNNMMSTESTLKFAEQACRVTMAPARAIAHTNWKELCTKLRSITKEQQEDIGELQNHADELMKEINELKELRDIFEKVYSKAMPELHYALEEEGVLQWFDPEVVNQTEGTVKEFEQAARIQKEKERTKLEKRESLMKAKDAQIAEFGRVQADMLNNSQHLPKPRNPGHRRDYSRSMDFNRLDDTLDLPFLVEYFGRNREHNALHERCVSQTQAHTDILEAFDDAEFDEKTEEVSDDSPAIRADMINWEVDENEFRSYLEKERQTYGEIWRERRMKTRRGKNFSSGDLVAQLSVLEHEEQISTLRYKINLLKKQLKNQSKKVKEKFILQDVDVGVGSPKQVSDSTFEEFKEPQNEFDLDCAEETKEDTELQKFLEDCGPNYLQYFDILTRENFHKTRLECTFEEELMDIIPNNKHRRRIIQIAQGGIGITPIADLFREKTPSEVVKEFMNFYNAHDAERMVDLFSNECINQQFALAKKETRGQRETKKAYNRMFKTFPKLGCEVLNIHETSDSTAIVEWKGWSTEENFKNEIFLHGCGIFQVHDGLISSHKAYWDRVRWEEQKGIDLVGRPTWTFTTASLVAGCGVSYYIATHGLNGIGLKR